MISEEQLANRTFTGNDGIFITDRTDLEHLERSGNFSFRDAWLLPLTFDALGAVLRSGQKRIRPHFDNVDFELCQKVYRTAEPQSRKWLSDLGLEFEVDDIDVVDLDAPNQFLLFNQISYIENLAKRTLDANPFIETFFGVSSADPLPQDLHFDSDTAAAVLRFVCERHGRGFQTLSMMRRRYKFPAYSQRPFLKGGIDQSSAPPLHIPRRSQVRVGFCSGGVANAESITRELRNLNYETVLFNSSWGLPSSLGIADSECPVDLSSFVQMADPGAEGYLLRLWNTLQEARSRSSLTDAVIRNPYLDFQFQYIITRRWLRLASLIRAATRVTREIPIKLLICCDLSHDEGAILARAYRSVGVKILVAPHSGWPCDLNWSSLHVSDTAMTQTRTAAQRLTELTGVSRVFVLGERRGYKCKSLLGRSAATEHGVLSAKRELASGRLIVVVLTNALELLSVPFVAPAQHIQSMSLLTQVPDRLRSKLLVAVRTKPGSLSEDPIIYKTFASFSGESLSFLDGLTFSQCLQVADCVIGINLPTSGYFEILERGVPLIHMQLAAVTTKHPDLPHAAILQITSPLELWPTIESILLEPACREKALQTQRRFIRDDLTPNFAVNNNPVGTVLRKLTKNYSPKSAFLALAGHISNLTQKAVTSHSLLSRVRSGGGAGSVDDVIGTGDGEAYVQGWAIDIMLKTPARIIYVVIDGKVVTKGVAGLPRPDVVDAFGDVRVIACGFSVPIHLPPPRQTQLSVYAELHDGSMHELVRDLSVPNVC